MPISNLRFKAGVSFDAVRLDYFDMIDWNLNASCVIAACVFLCHFLMGSIGGKAQTGKYRGKSVEG